MNAVDTASAYPTQAAAAEVPAFVGGRVESAQLGRTQALITSECDAIKELLLAKNRGYGNSATDPVRIFSRASAEEQIRVRIDDKLSRLQRGQLAPARYAARAPGEPSATLELSDDEDTVLDLIGYLILLRVCHRLPDSGPPKPF
jgi:hypothetical protein